MNSKLTDSGLIHTPDADQHQLLLEVITAHHKLYFDIETVRKELADMTAQRDRLMWGHAQVCEKADVERLDARRWRALPDTGWHVGPEFVTYNDVIESGDNFNFGKEALDAAIDKATGGQP
jgi:hypothetical protein